MTLAILAVIAMVLSFLAGIWTDVLWFDSVDFRSVFVTTLSTRILLFVLGGLVVGGMVAASMIIAYRTKPFVVPVTEAQQTLHQYRQALDPVRRLATIVAPAGLALLAGTAAAGQWGTWLMWRNGTDFGVTDPQFNRDISFYVFTLPMIEFVIGFLTMALLLSLAAAAFIHYVYGGLQLPGRGPSTRAAYIHLGVLGALLALVRAANYWFSRYSLAVSDSELLTGIGYTDDKAVLPTKAILAVAAVMCAGLFLAAVWTRSWRLPIVGVVLLTVTSVVVGGLYPAVIQQFRVNPSEKSLEAPYIQRSIDATRAAYGIDDIEVSEYDASVTVSAGQLRDDAETIPGIRLVDPIVVSPTFRQLQALRSYYAFPDALDVDRYTIDGEETDAVVAVRELQLSGVPESQRNWINDHTVYTHGFGFVGAYGNRRTDDGEPVYFERNIPPAGKLGDFEPRVYFGEESPQYSVVGSPEGAEPREFDFPDSSAGGQAKNTYTGEGGVPIGSLPRRIAYGIKYREINFLLADALNEQSRILDHRMPFERVNRVAPWLTTDGNAYPSVIDGRMVWIIDGYTTSSSYPYSRLVDLGQATNDSTTERAASVRTIGSGLRINYIRNSVKATVDAYDGTVTLYEWDETDPLLKAWKGAFPDTVTPRSEISGDLMAHLRYPEDLFKVQRTMLSRYHVDEADSFYGGQDWWRVPKDPAQEDTSVDQPAYYLSIGMPTQKEPTFSLTTTFMPVGDREVLSGFLAVDSEAGDADGQPREGYGKMRLLELPRDSNVNGPGQVQNDINSSSDTNPAFGLTLSQFLNNNNRDGSRVTHGNLLTIPVGGGLLYVQPIYISGTAASAYPKSRITVAAFGTKLAWSDTLNASLDRLFQGESGATAGDSGTESPDPGAVDTGSDAGGTDSDTGGTTGTDSGNSALDAALADIQQAFADGQAALRDGDFTAYGEAQQRLQEAIARAVAAAPEGGVVDVAPAPEPSPTP